MDQIAAEKPELLPLNWGKMSYLFMLTLEKPHILVRLEDEMDGFKS